MQRLITLTLLWMLSAGVHAAWEYFGYTGKNWSVTTQDFQCDGESSQEFEGKGVKYYNSALCFVENTKEFVNKNKVPGFAIRRSTDVFFETLPAEDKQFYKNNPEFNEIYQSALDAQCKKDDIVISKVSKTKKILCQALMLGRSSTSPTGNKGIMASLNDNPGTFITCGYMKYDKCASFNPNCEYNTLVSRIKSIPAEAYDDYVGLRSTTNPHRYPRFDYTREASIGEEYYDLLFRPAGPVSQAALLLARLGEAQQAEALAKAPPLTPAQIKTLSDRAERGDAEAAFALGLRAALGWGMARDTPAALRHFQQAARQGHALGLAALAVHYQRGLAGGIGPERANPLAYQYYQMARPGLSELDGKWAQRQIDALKQSHIQTEFGRLDAAASRWAPGQALPK
jgi:TPR repeat protein